MSFVEIGHFFSSHFGQKDALQISPMNVGRLEVDADFVIRKTYDKMLTSIFAEAKLPGKNLVHLIKQCISTSDYNKLLPILQTLIIKQDVIQSATKNNPFDCLKICTLGASGRKNIKYIRFEFRKNDNFDKTGHWTVILRDISKSVRVSKQIKRTTQKAELKVNTMMSLLQFERDLVKEFLETTIYSLKSILKNLSATSRDSAEVKKRIENIYCIVHQVKGDAAILNLDSISGKAHQFENLLSTLNLKRNLHHSDLHHLAKPLKSMIDSVKEVKELFEKIVEGGWNSARNSGGGDTMMRRLQYLIKRLAEDNRKRVIIVDDGYLDSAVPLYLRRVVSSLVTQLARNAVVHGIEDAKTRIKRNKTPYGCLHVSVSHNGSKLVVTTRDDGCGIDPEKIKHAAMNSKLFDRRHVASWNKTQLLNALFKPGFTTAKTVTQHAGRGVGLDVIKSTVEKFGGTINIKSALGEFTEFSMVFPRRAIQP